MKWDIQRIKDRGPLCDYFKVSGGHLTSPLTMGWHIMDDRGFTTGVCRDHDFVEYVEKAGQRLDLMVTALAAGCPHGCAEGEPPCPHRRWANKLLAALKGLP